MKRLAMKKNKIKAGSIIQSIFVSFLLFLNIHFAYAQSTQGGIIPNGLNVFLDKNGKPLTGGSVYFYTGATGSTVPKTTYSDINLTNPNTNPVILNAAGQAALWGTGNYRQQVFDKNNNLIWDVLTSAAGSGSSGGGSIATGDGDLVGTIKPWAGPVAPNQYMFAYGAQISRTTFSALFTAITSAQSIFCNSGSPTLVGLGDTTNFWIGMTVEVSCVPAGVTTVISKTSTTVTLAVNANATVNTTATFFMWGNGDGITTFTLPDFRGVVPMGNNIMGGVASSNMSDAYFGTQSANSAGGLGGSPSVGLLLSNMPAISSNVSGITLTNGGLNTSGAGGAGGACNNAGGQCTGGSQTDFMITTAAATTTSNPNSIVTVATQGSSTSTNTGGIAVSSTIAAGGSGYTNGSQTITVAGGTCTTQPQFTITVSGNALSGTPTLLTAGLCSVIPSNPAATTGGGGISGTLNVTYSEAPFSIVQPSRTVNYIIKVTPDANSATASGVTSFGGMTGSIACGSGLICTGNTVTATVTLGNISGLIFGNGLSGPPTAYTGTSCANQFIDALNGSGVATCASVNTSFVLNSAITYAKIQNESATTLLGNPTGSATSPSEITLGSTLNFSGTTLNCTTSTSSQIGCSKPDGTTITESAGILTAIGGVATSVQPGSTTITSGTNHTVLTTGTGTLSQAGPGSVGQALISGGSSAEPTFKSGTWVLLNTLTANNTATTLADTTSITSSYTEYEIVIEQMLPATTNITLQLQVQVSTFQNTSYLSSVNNANGSASGSVSSTSGILLSNTTNVPNTAPGVNAKLLLSNPAQTLTCKIIEGTYGYVSTTMITGTTSGCYNGGSAAITGVQVITSSGNLFSGVMKIYGRVS